MAVAVNISPTKSTESHSPRCRRSSQNGVRAYGVSTASTPPKRSCVSVSSVCEMSSASSTVMMPSMCPCSSTTASAERS